MSGTGRILIVDDEKTALKNLQYIMKKEGYEVSGAQSGTSALKQLEKQKFDLVLTDLRMEQVDGMEVLEKAKELYPDCEVIIITAYATIPSAVDTVKKGAYDYIAKPYKLDEVRKVVKAAFDKVYLKRENAILREQIEKYEGKARIITNSLNMKNIIDMASQIAPTDCSVIIMGESGTGKELLARHIHNASRRAERPFMAINCGAMNEELLDNELFGHEKGAFTGAHTLKKGLFEVADGGTLLLDEVTEMAPAMQVKLLRVLQEGELLRLGGTRTVKANVRVIAATNRDVQEMVKKNKFRQDLYFRLNVVSLYIPPLRERRDDIVMLCQHFLNRSSTLMEKNVNEISPEAMEILMNYDFPGNVRELENIIERGVALSNESKIGLAHLSDDIKSVNVMTYKSSPKGMPSLEDQEISYIRWVMNETHGNKTAAAEILGIDRVSLWRKLKRYNIEEV